MSVGGALSVAEPDPTVEEVLMGPALREASRGLDTVGICGIFSRRAVVMRSPPRFRSALVGITSPILQWRLQGRCETGFAWDCGWGGA